MYLTPKRDHTKKEKKNDDVDIKIILSSTSEYDSTSLNLCYHHTQHFILFYLPFRFILICYISSSYMHTEPETPLFTSPFITLIKISQALLEVQLH